MVKIKYLYKDKLFFENSKGNKLCCVISNPVPVKRSITIFCHGLGSSKDSNSNRRLENILNNKGIATFRFDFYGHGESEGKFEYITISEAVDDISHAIKFVKKQGYVDIGILGSSFGGLASIIVASKSKDLSFLVLKSPVSNYEEKATNTKTEIEKWKFMGYKYFVGGDGKKLKLNYSFVEDFKKNNGYDYANNINIPTFIIHGDKDEVVPIAQSKKLTCLIKGSELEVIDGADHRYSKHKDFKRMLYIISLFIIKNAQYKSR